MMRDWDEKTRAWVRRSVARHFPLDEGEEVGQNGRRVFHEDWLKPGVLAVYITNQRLVVFRRDPKEILWETQLAHINALRLSDEKTIGAEIRTRLLVDTADGVTTMLSASAPDRIRDLIGHQQPHPVNAGIPGATGRNTTVDQARMVFGTPRRAHYGVVETCRSTNSD